MADTYVCTHCGWAGENPNWQRHGKNSRYPWCPECPYMVVKASEAARKGS